METLSKIHIPPETIAKIDRRIRFCDYVTVAELYLKDNFLLKRPLAPEDIKPRLLGHWGTCPGINLAYANLKTFFKNDQNFSFILGPGHGFPALQANLFYDDEVETIPENGKPPEKLPRSEKGLAYLCRNFSYPGGYPSHASPLTPGVITEGGELGYALASAYGAALGHPEKTLAVLIGDGELETATALDSLNLNHLLATSANGHVLPILHLNGYKISAPSLYARFPKHELNSLIRGFGYEPFEIDENIEKFQQVLTLIAQTRNLKPFLIMKTEKGMTGPNAHQDSHQIPLKNPKTDQEELRQLENWLKSYRIAEAFDLENRQESKTTTTHGGSNV